MGDKTLPTKSSGLTKDDIALMVRELVLVTLPHKDPGAVPEWVRRNGNITLAIQPGGAFILQRHRQPWFSIPLLSPVWSAVFSSRNQFQVGTSRRHLGECGLVIALILLGFMERPIRIAIAIDHQRSEFENGFASFQSPPGPREIHTIFHQITTSPFDHPRGDGIPLGQV